VLCSHINAKVTGLCSNCHTMHNSQGGASMLFTTDLDSAPNPALTRGDCIGCHGQDPGGTQHIVTEIPQVLHSGGTDLAAGNFAYIKGLKTRESGDANTVGHNVIDLSQNETVLTVPPGDQHGTAITNANFTCAGMYGCHGDREKTSSFDAISGGHHSGVSGLCNTADTVANSYRFLLGVKGHENMDATYKYQNYNSQYHNEYYGVSNRGTEGGLYSPGSNSMSGLCAECHGHFHGTYAGDIGTASPWLRHPTDILLPDKTEYSAYTSYSVTAPVARTDITTVNEVANKTVTPDSDIVMCLSCHGAHATAYYKLMRWDNQAGNSGCAVCHTSKN